MCPDTVDESLKVFIKTTVTEITYLVSRVVVPVEHGRPSRFGEGNSPGLSPEEYP